MTVPTGSEELADLIGPVADRFAAAGFRLYVVGGVVRDLALNEVRGNGIGFDPAGNDIDLTTDARPADIKKLLAPLAEALWTQGERFGTIGATVAGQPLEITTHRAEAYDPESRKPVVTFGRDLDEDLSRRDFTINAAAIELPGLVLHDPFNGVADLRSGTLRTPLSPELSFTDDPLRMMRAARFMSRLALIPDPALVTAAEALADRLAIVSVERISDELERLLALPDPGTGLRFLADTGLLDRIITGYGHRGDQAAGSGIDVDRDGGLAADRDSGLALASAADDPLVRRAGLLWPVRAAASAELKRLRYSRATTTRTVRLLEATASVLGSTPDAELIRRAVGLVGLDDIDRVATLAALVSDRTDDSPVADRADRANWAGRAERFDAVLDAVRLAEDLSDLEAPLSGTEIMAVLAIEPGPMVGKATNMLREHRLTAGPFGRDEAEQLLLAWWRETGPDGKPGPTFR